VAEIEVYVLEVGELVRLGRAEGTVERVRESVPPGYLVAETRWTTGARCPVPARLLALPSGEAT
jgi:hypothetical protein